MSCPLPPLASAPGESYFYVAIIIQAVLYGVELVLYFKTIHVLFVRRPHRTSNVFYAIFSTVMLALITFSVATTAYYGQVIWVLNAGYPGGPSAYAEAHVIEWYNLFGSVASIVLQQMTDGLMMHRSRVVWDSYRVVIMPFVLWLATLVFGILLCWTSNSYGKPIFLELNTCFALAYYSISVFLNLALTTLICARVLLHEKSVREHIGAEYTSPYLRIVMLLVESALPFALCGVLFGVTFGVGSPFGLIFSRVYILMMAISPQILILRVAEGSAWSADSVRQPPGSTIKFCSASTSTQHAFSEGKVDAFDVENAVPA